MAARRFTVGERVRVAEWFTEFRGATGTVVWVTDVTGDGWVAQDLTVEFDRPVVPFEDGEPWPRLHHSAHNFELIDDVSHTAQPTRRRLAHKQPPPPAYQACDGCRYPGHACTCAEGGPAEEVANRPPAGFVPFSGTPHHLWAA